MDLVYICRSGDNEELRYSLRSAQENASYDNVWLIGGKPGWYSGDFVDVPNSGKNKFENIKTCISIIPKIGSISDDFILMNDDFFFIKKTGTMPTYHGGLLIDKIKQYQDLGAKKYATLLSKTYKDLIRQGIKDPLDYDIHLPMPMNKQKLKESIKKAYFPRSGYGNIHSVGGELVKDVKIYSLKNQLASKNYDFTDNNIAFISTEDSSFGYVHKTILNDMFRYQSIYEKY